MKNIFFVRILQYVKFKEAHSIYLEANKKFLSKLNKSRLCNFYFYRNFLDFICIVFFQLLKSFGIEY